MRRGWMVVMVAAGGLVGCGDDGPMLVDAAARSPVATEGPAAVEIVAEDNVFRPKQLTVAAGTPVRFVNHGRNDHNTVAVAVAGEEWGVATADFRSGAAYVHVFDEPGTYRFYCSLHGIADFGMTGEIVVQPADE